MTRTPERIHLDGEKLRSPRERFNAIHDELEKFNSRVRVRGEYRLESEVDDLVIKGYVANRIRNGWRLGMTVEGMTEVRSLRGTPLSREPEPVNDFLNLAEAILR